MTKRPIVRFHNTETDEITDREMNDAEFAQFEKDKAEFEAKLAAEQEKDAARKVLLDKLGITAEEAKLLLS